MVIPIPLRNHHTVSCSWCNIIFPLTAHTLPVSSHPCRLVILLLNSTHPKVYEVVHLIVVLKCISLIISDVEHLFKCLLAKYKSSLEKCLFKSFAHLWIGFLLLLSFRSYLYILILIPYQTCDLQKLSPLLWAAFFTLLILSFWYTEFNFHEVHSVYFFLLPVPSVS